MKGQKAGAEQARKRRPRITRIVMTPSSSGAKDNIEEAGNGHRARQGYFREVTLVYRWAKVPEWLETSRPVYGSRDAWPFFRRLENKVREHFMALYLSGSNAPIAVETVHVGGLTGVYSDAGEILRSALHLGAAAVIVAHNHPSTSPRPSFEDEQVFEQLQRAAALVGVKVLDSLIIVPGTYYSLADAKGLKFSLECYRENTARRASRAQAKAARAVHPATPSPASPAAG